MAYSYFEYTADGNTSTFAVPFAYVSQDEVEVYVDGAQTTDFTFTSSNTITLGTTPANAATVRVGRSTNLTQRAVDFTTGAVLTENDLDTALIQVFHASQEAIDTAGEAISKDTDGIFDAQNRRIKNVANPVNAQDAATKNYLETVWLSPTDKANIATVAGISTQTSQVAAIDTDVTTVSGISTDIQTLADIEDGTTATDAISKVAAVDTNVTTVANRDADIVVVSARDTDIGTVAARDADIGTVAARDADIGTVATDLNDPASKLDAVSTNIQQVIDTGLQIGNVVTVANNMTDVNQVASDTVALNSVYNNIGAVSNVSTNMAAVTNVNTNMAAVTNVSTNMPDILSVEAEVAKVVAVANDLQETVSEIDTVANSIANVDLVGGSISNVNQVAANIADVNNFADTYSIGATAPVSPTTGDLWFDTVNNTMKVYDGSGFVNAGSSVSGVANSVEYTATANQTSFAATYDAGAVDVYLNGVKLAASDFTATDGSNVVLGSGAAAGDTVFIQSFGTFALSTHYTKTETDNLLANIDALPDQTGHSGQFLTTDGTTADWASVDALPSQTGHAGQFLTTDGTTASWADTGAKEGIFWENGTTISSNYTIPTNTNAGSFGPITIASGVTVTISAGSTWTVV